MAYLLSQYALLFLLTALVSFLLGRWWVQRRFIDITESWESLRSAREADEGFRDRLWTGLEELRRSVAPTVRTELAALPQPEVPEPNFDRLLIELKRIESRIDAIRPTPATDLKPVQSRLDTLDARLNGLKLPSAPDLAPLEARLSVLEALLRDLASPDSGDGPAIVERLAELERAVLALPQPAALQDLTPVIARISALDAFVRESAEQAPAQPLVDLSGLDARLDALADQLSDRPAAPAFDEQPLLDRLSRLEQTLARLPRVERQDLQSIHFRAGEIERLLRAQPTQGLDGHELMVRMAGLEDAVQGWRQQAVVEKVGAEPAPAASQAAEPISAPQLFEAPTQGAPDDLKRISGVGPKLEALLNRNGVFYFWQVASWSAAEIRFMDERLEVFKGRIERDHWVTQAQALAAPAVTGADGADLFSGS